MIDELIAKARSLGPIRISVVHAEDEFARAGAREAERLGLMTPVFDSTPEDAVKRAVAGDVAAIMKGTIHSDVLLHALVNEPALHRGRRVSHVVVAELANRAKPLLVSDAAVNIAPDLDAKRDIVQNAIDTAHALGIDSPRVAILSAVETVAAQIPSTIDAAALTEMATRGQITGGIVDGPLALDDAVSVEAARAKGITSPAAGNADILIAPDLDAGNIIYKALERLVHARCGGIVVGATVPVVLTSRADSIDARVISTAVARLLCAHSERNV